MMMRGVLVVSCVVMIGKAHADPTPSPPPIPLTCTANAECPNNATCSEGECVVSESSSGPKLDVVVLKSGERVEGHVKEQVRGQFVVIDTGGSTRTLMWDAIAEVVVSVKQAGGPTVVLAPGTGKALEIGNKKPKKKVVRVATTSGIKATKEGLDLSRTVTCKTDNDPTCKETEKLTIGSEGPKATYSSETDCSKKPGSGTCKETKQLGVSKAGFGASITTEEVVGVDDAKRPSRTTNFSATGLAGLGFGDGSTISITNFDANMKLLVGSKKFPGNKGGNWVGFALEPTLGFVLLAVFGNGTSFTMTGARGGTSAGVQLMKFGKLDGKTLRQKGIGVFLGAFLGYQATAGTINTGFGSMTIKSSSPSIGPQINLVLPDYNAGTSKYKAKSLNFMILPTGSNVFISIGFSTSF